MSTNDEKREYEKLLADLENDHAAFLELCDELEAISIAEREMEETFKRAEKHLEIETKEGIEAALNELRPLFEHIDLD